MSPSRLVSPATRRPATSQNGSGDTVVGIVFGCVGAANLVQGSWTRSHPWLDLTSAAFALGGIAALFALRRRVPLAGIGILLLLFGALVLGYVEPALSSNAAEKRSNLLLGVAFVAIASFLALWKPRRLRAFLITLVVLAMVVLVGQFITPDPVALVTGRRTPLGLNAIGAGRALGSALVVVVALLLYPGRRRHFYPLLLLGVALGIGLYYAGSRGPVVGVLIAALFLVWKRPGIKLPARLGLLIMLAIGAVFAYRESLQAGSRLVSIDSSGRQELYSQALQIALDHPTGVGWGNFFRYLPPTILQTEPGESLYAHNIVLEFWIEAGLLGALLFVIFALAVLRICSRSARQSPVSFALAGLAISLFAGAMLSSDLVGNRMLWVVCGAVLAAVGSARTGTSARAGTPSPTRARPISR